MMQSRSTFGRVSELSLARHAARSGAISKGPRAVTVVPPRRHSPSQTLPRGSSNAPRRLPNSRDQLAGPVVAQLRGRSRSVDIGRFDTVGRMPLSLLFTSKLVSHRGRMGGCHDENRTWHDVSCQDFLHFCAITSVPPSWVDGQGRRKLLDLTYENRGDRYGLVSGV
jgi:hypothetical protein